MHRPICVEAVVREVMAAINSAYLELRGNFPIMLVLSIIMSNGRNVLDCEKSAYSYVRKNFSPSVRFFFPPLTWSSKSLSPSRDYLPHGPLLLAFHF